MQRFIADDWPLRLWMNFGPLAAIAAVCWYTRPVPWLAEHWTHPVMFAVVLVLTWVTGWYAAIIPGWFVLGPLYYRQGVSNGAPYCVGDIVRILSRHHRGRVVRVYEVWEPRDQVRVELGDDEQSKVTDVFSYYEVCRVSPRKETVTTDADSLTHSITNLDL